MRSKGPAVSRLFVWFALLLSASAVCAQTTAGTAASHHAAGVEHLRAGRLNDARAEFGQALRLDPNHLPSLVDLADLFSSIGAVFEGYSVIQHAARLAPGDPRVQLLLGRCLFLLKKLPEARASFHRALELDPALLEPHFALAAIENEQGRYAEARRHIEAYLRRAKGTEVIQAQRARVRIALAMKDYDEALKAYATLEEANPDDNSVQMEIARTLLTANRYPQAEQAFRALSEKKPRQAEVWRGLFDAAYNRGAYDQAIRAMQQLARLEPHSCEPLLHMARSYRMLNQVAEARQHAQRCLALSPQQAFAHYLLGRIWFSEGDLQRAKQELQQSVDSNPEFADALFWLASAELKLGDKAGVAHLEKAVQLDPESAAAHYALAVEYNRLNRREQARQHLEAFRLLKQREKWQVQASEGGMSLMGEGPASGSDDNLGGADWLNFGKYLVQQNKPRDALALLEEARRRTPRNSEVLRMIAVAHTELGEIEQALVLYEEAEKYDPSGLLYLGRGKIYFRMGEVQQAQEDLRRATTLELPPDKAAEAHLLLASLANGQKRYSDAEAALRRALELEPRNTAARGLLTWTLLRLGRAADAVAEGRQAVALNSNDASARLALAQAFIEQRQLGDAVRQLQAATEAQGENGQVLFVRGQLAAAQGLRRVAIDYLAHAAEVDPTQVEIFYRWGLLLREEGRLGEATRAFQKATVVDPGHARSWLELGTLYLAADQAQVAASFLRNAVGAEPDNAEAHYQLALALGQAGQLVEAEQEARRAQALGHAGSEQLLRSLAGQKRP